MVRCRGGAPWPARTFSRERISSQGNELTRSTVVTNVAYCPVSYQSAVVRMPKESDAMMQREFKQWDSRTRKGVKVTVRAGESS